MKFLPIHAGMHKTGSTFLQQNVFPLLFNTEGRIPNTGKESAILSNAISEICSDPVQSAKLRRAIPSESSLFLSAEAYSGRQRAHYKNESIERFWGFMKGLEEIERFRETRTVIFFREHREWLISGFLNQKRQGVQRSFTEHCNAFSESDLNWTIRAKQLSRYNCRMFDFNDFIESPEHVVKKICTFWDLPLREEIDYLQRVNDSSYNLIDLYLHYLTNTCLGVARKFGVQWAARQNSVRIIRELSNNRLANKCFNINEYKKSLVVPKEIDTFCKDDWARVRKFVEEV